MAPSTLVPVIDSLREISEDGTVPKNVRASVQEVMLLLSQPADAAMKVSKALQILEEITDDDNMHAEARMQLMNISSMLE